MAFYSLWIGLPLLSALFQASTKMLAAEMRHTPFSWSWLVQATHSPWAVVVLLSELLSFCSLAACFDKCAFEQGLPDYRRRLYCYRANELDVVQRTGHAVADYRQRADSCGCLVYKHCI